MNSGSEHVADEMSQLNRNAGSRDSSRAVALFAIILLLQIAVYYQSYWSMVETWWRSETFAHGFLIFPISLYLIWSRRKHLSGIPIQTDYRALPLLAGCGFVWLLASLADVLVIEQLATVAMIPLLVWAILGIEIVWALAFPLAYMLFAVPAGEFLVPPMMEFTADFTVAAIQLTGIPVFREGLFFTLPSGSWSVVEACSGVRYIIASLTLGCLYAYLTYRSYWRRAGFILLSIMVPIIANGLRAYMIVMIGHLSSMKLATGVDHLIYGWLWFGVVMFLMFWVGSWWRDNQTEEDYRPGTEGDRSPGGQTRGLSLGMTVALVFLWPAWAYAIGQRTANTGFTLTAPQVEGWHRKVTDEVSWQPHYVAPSQLVMQTYRNEADHLGLVLAYYENQRQGNELISAQNVLLPSSNKQWRQSGPLNHYRPELGEANIQVVETQIRSANQELLVWRWNIINGVHTTNDYYGKLIEAWSQLKGESRRGMGVVLYSPLTGNEPESARRVLRTFLRDLLPKLDSTF